MSLVSNLLVRHSKLTESGQFTLDLYPTVVQILTATHLENNPVQLQLLQLKLQEIQSTKEEASKHVSSQLSPASTGSDEESTTALSDNSSLEETLEILKCDVEALIELSPALEDPVPDTVVSTLEEPASPQTQPTVEVCKSMFFKNGITEKFRRCNDALATAISKAIYRTYFRLTNERKGAAASQPELGVARREKSASEILPKDSGYETGTRAPTLLIDDGASMSYAESLSSYIDIDGGTSPPFPSQPKDLAIGDEFTCIACGRQVAKSRSGDAWKYIRLFTKLHGSKTGLFELDVC